MAFDLTRQSVQTRLAMLSESERDAVLGGLSNEEVAALQYDWEFCGRPDQLEAHHSTMATILFSAGRGAGKTRGGSEWVKEKVRQLGPSGRIALVARTAPDVRDTMIQGESGLINVYPPSEEPKYIASARRLNFANGAHAICFTAEEPSQLRGPQFHASWADEVAAWDQVPDDSGLTAWDNLTLATRLGDNPQVFATTTPKRIALMRSLYKRAAEGDGVSLHTASTYDNVHLASAYLNTIRGLYEGTRLGAQELYAQLMADVEGALWKEEALNEDRVNEQPGDLPLRVVGVDPSVADDPGDECGIIVCGATGESNSLKRHAYILADRSVKGAPLVWAKAAVKAAREYDAPIVAEINQGGAMVREMVHSIDKGVRVRTVHAKQGKSLRAEAVTLAYDQHRIHHVGTFPLLEDQMTGWVPGETKQSPDRIDALVHGLTALVVPSAYKAGIGIATVRSARSSRIKTGLNNLPGRTR